LEPGVSIRAVLIDLDDTLIESSNGYEIATEVALVEFEKAHKTGRTPAELKQDYVHARTKTKERLSANSPSSHNRLIYFKALLEQRTGRCAPNDFFDLIRHYEEALLKTLVLAEEPELRRLSAKVPFALVTDETLYTQMRKLGRIDPTGDLFRVVITSEEMGVEKPERLGFEEALSRLGVSAADTVMIGDSFEKDMRGAAQLGIPGWWICAEGKRPPDDKLPLVGYGPLAKALRWLDRALGER